MVIRKKQQETEDFERSPFSLKVTQRDSLRHASPPVLKRLANFASRVRSIPRSQSAPRPREASSRLQRSSTPLKMRSQSVIKVVKKFFDVDSDCRSRSSSTVKPSTRSKSQSPYKRNDKTRIRKKRNKMNERETEELTQLKQSLYRWEFSSSNPSPVLKEKEKASLLKLRQHNAGSPFSLVFRWQSCLFLNTNDDEALKNVIDDNDPRFLCEGRLKSGELRTKDGRRVACVVGSFRPLDLVFSLSASKLGIVRLTTTTTCFVQFTLEANFDITELKIEDIVLRNDEKTKQRLLCELTDEYKEWKDKLNYEIARDYIKWGRAKKEEIIPTSKNQKTDKPLANSTHLATRLKKFLGWKYANLWIKESEENNPNCSGWNDNVIFFKGTIYNDEIDEDIVSTKASDLIAELTDQYKKHFKKKKDHSDEHSLEGNIFESNPTSLAARLQWDIDSWRNADDWLDDADSCIVQFFADDVKGTGNAFNPVPDILLLRPTLVAYSGGESGERFLFCSEKNRGGKLRFGTIVSHCNDGRINVRVDNTYELLAIDARPSTVILTPKFIYDPEVRLLVIEPHTNKLMDVIVINRVGRGSRHLVKTRDKLKRFEIDLNDMNHCEQHFPFTSKFEAARFNYFKVIKKHSGIVSGGMNNTQLIKEDQKEKETFEKSHIINLSGAIEMMWY